MVHSNNQGSTAVATHRPQLWGRSGIPSLIDDRQTTHHQLVFTEVSCQEENCRQAEFLPVSCNLCSKKFCSSHSRPEKHKCHVCIQADGTFRHPDDSRVSVCSTCSVPITERNTVPNDAVRTVTTTISGVEAELKQLVAHSMAEQSRLRGLDTAAAAMLDGDGVEDEVRRSGAGRVLVQRIRDLKDRRSDMLLALHLERGCATTRKVETCGVAKCKTKGGFKSKCKRCQETFCLSHRLPEVHDCENVITKRHRGVAGALSAGGAAAQQRARASAPAPPTSQQTPPTQAQNLSAASSPLAPLAHAPALEQMTEMGFDPKLSAAALLRCQNDVGQAIATLLQ